MRYKIIATKRFQKDVKRCIKRNLPMERLKEVVRLLESSGSLPPKYNLTSFQDNMRENGNAISCLIGC